MAINKKPSQWGKPPHYTLTEVEAFDAMRAFVEAFMKRGDPNSEGLHRLISFTNRNEALNLEPGDPAQWEDWLEAVATVKARTAVQP